MCALWSLFCVFYFFIFSARFELQGSASVPPVCVRSACFVPGSSMFRVAAVWRLWSGCGVALLLMLWLAFFFWVVARPTVHAKFVSLLTNVPPPRFEVEDFSSCPVENEGATMNPGAVMAPCCR